MTTTISTVVLSDPARTAMIAALNAQINAGTGAFLRVLDGATVLAEVELDATSAFVAGAPGVIELDVTPVPSDLTAAASGTPDNYELVDQLGGNVVATGTITSDDTVNAGQPVNVTSWSLTMPAS